MKKRFFILPVLLLMLLFGVGFTTTVNAAENEEITTPEVVEKEVYIYEDEEKIVHLTFQDERTIAIEIDFKIAGGHHTGVLEVLHYPTEDFYELTSEEINGWFKLDKENKKIIPIPDKNIYVYEDEEGRMELNLLDYKTAKIKIIQKSDGATLEQNVNYLYHYDKQIFELLKPGTPLNVKLDKATKTLTIIEPEQEPEPEIVFPCNVVIEDIAFGDIIVDKEGGEIGDIVTILARPFPMCELVSIKANGVDLVPNEDGNYTFALAEGDNIISVDFELSSDKLKEIAGLFEDAKKGDWDKIFSIENLLTLINFIFTTLFSSGFLITLLKNKKLQAKTTDEVIKVVTDVLDDKVSKTILDFLRETLEPITSKIDGKLVDIVDTVKMLASCMVLAQQNDDASRKAIIELLTNFQKKDADFADQVKAVIAKETEKNEEVQKQKAQAIEELEKANENINEKVEEPTIEEIAEDENVKGRI